MAENRDLPICDSEATKTPDNEGERELADVAISHGGATDFYEADAAC